MAHAAFTISTIHQMMSNTQPETKRGKEYDGLVSRLTVHPIKNPVPIIQETIIEPTMILRKKEEVIYLKENTTC